MPSSAPAHLDQRPALTPDQALIDQHAKIVGVALFLVVLGLFLPTIRHDFNIYDDRAYVTENLELQRGLTWENIRWAFGGFRVWFYHPLTMVSHMIDCQLFGLKPWGHHLTSVLIHALNALLAFKLLKNMTGTVWRSAFAALFFGIHPLRVESVAWVAERKDVLSTCFWLLTMLCYVRYAKERECAGAKAKRHYLLALVCFALGLLSKPMLVTLPFALLLLDYWPLRRLSFGITAIESDASTVPSSSKSRTLFSLILEKIPFFILAGIGSLLTIAAQKSVGAMSSLGYLPFIVRIDNALISYCRYLGKFFAPINLALLYPYNQGNWPAWQIFLASALLLSVSIWAVMALQKRPYVAVGWFWFLGTLVPAIGLVQVGGQAMADRFSYVPSIGFFILVVWGFYELTQRLRSQAAVVGTIAAAATLSCAAITEHQLSFWKNSETLFRHAIEVTDNNAVMHYDLGTALETDPQRLPEAIAEFEAVLRIDPYDANAHVKLGDLLERFPDRLADAISHYETALQLNPDAIATHAAHYNLGIARAKTGRLPEAIIQFKEAIRMDPQDPDSHINLGIALFKSRRFPEAMEQFQEALRLRPDSPIAHYNLGATLERTQGRQEEAIAEYRETLHIDPTWAPATKALERLGVTSR